MVKSSRKAWDEGIRAETILAKADVHIAPDYANILHNRVDQRPLGYWDNNGRWISLRREKSVVPAIVWGVAAALVIAGLSAVLS